MPPFRRLDDTQLNRLSSDDLLAYVRVADAAGEDAAWRLALKMLVYKHMDDVTRRVALKFPKGSLVVEDVASKALGSAIVTAVRAEQPPEHFWGWLNTIVDRRIADHYRAKHLDTQPLVSEHEGDEDVWGAQPTVEGESEAVTLRVVIDDVMAALSDVHRAVVDLYAFCGFSAIEAAEKLNAARPDLEPPMSEANVHAIYSRFRKRLVAALDGDTGSASP